jgi:SAM-dependent methyltransferase
LHAAVELDIFSAIGPAKLTAGEVAGRLSCDARAMTRLLDALSAMALLIKDGEAYALTPFSADYLVKTSDRYLGHIIAHHHHLVPSWAALDEAVRGGKPTRRRAVATDDARREAFLMGMFNIASMQAPQIVEHIDLSQRRRLLDLGGGPGTYAIHFCLKNPRLEAVVFDLATTRPFAEKTIARYGLSDRIRFLPGDFLADKISGDFDVVWLSQILHGDGPDDCHRIVAKAAEALQPGGEMLIQEFILEASMDRPLLPALFSLNMLLGTEKGQSYSEPQLREMMSRAGIERIERLSYKGAMDSGILRGFKKKTH